LTKKINSLDFISAYREGKSYKEISLKQNCSITTVANRVKNLGLKRNGKGRELFSAEERYLFSKMLETRGGRKQLLYILRGK